MAQKLVIVESPHKAKTIQKFLPKGYEVQATKGHLVDLPKSRLGINIEDNFEPDYINVRGRADTINMLKKEAKKADEVLLATDPDREGEAISWHVANFLGIDPNSNCRVEFHEVTKRAVIEAIDNKHPVDMNLVDSQQARRVLDRLVGYSISPFLWKKVKRGLSAGRVQSVVTRMIVDREEEIQKFQPQEYWQIDLDLKIKGDRKHFKAELKTEDGKKIKIENKEQADKIENIINENPLEITNVKERIRKQKAPLPFTTSTLQQAAYNILGMTSQRTMRTAQELFEGVNIKGRGMTGLITYLRTDSTRLAPEAIDETHTYIEKNYGEKYSSKNKRKVKTNSNVQDAHEAIRPTSIELHPEMIKDSLSNDQYRLYNLIWKRMLASQMSDSEIKVVDVNIKCKNLGFKAKGESLVFPGFSEVLGNNKKLISLPNITKESKLELLNINKEQKFTSPPSRFTEATLIKQLEENGIGRPSTYSPTISTIKNRGYVEVENKKLKPTDLGFIVTDLMKEHFQDIVDIKFTAGMEESLDKVAEGNKDWKNLIGLFYTDFKTELEEAQEKQDKVEIKDPISDEVCENCGVNMVIKNGKYGKFLACPNWPECKNTKPYFEKTDGVCPNCGGQLIKKKSKKGRTFYGCVNYPECDFSSWDLPTAYICPECSQTIFQKGLGKRKKYYCIDHGEFNESDLKKKMEE